MISLVFKKANANSIKTCKKIEKEESAVWSERREKMQQTAQKPKASSIKIAFWLHIEKLMCLRFQINLSHRFAICATAAAALDVDVTPNT